MVNDKFIGHFEMTVSPDDNIRRFEAIALLQDYELYHEDDDLGNLSSSFSKLSTITAYQKLDILVRYEMWKYILDSLLVDSNVILTLQGYAVSSNYPIMMKGNILSPHDIKLIVGHIGVIGTIDDLDLLDDTAP